MFITKSVKSFIMVIIAGIIPVCLSAQSTFERIYGGNSGKSVEQTADGGYIIAGYTTFEGAGDYDVYLVKTNHTGDTLWTKTYGGSNRDFANEIQQTDDGGYIIAGQTMSFGAGGWDFWLIKTDSLGNTLWTKTFGGSNQDWCKSVDKTDDGGYILTGRYSCDNYGLGLIKTNSLGDTLWTKAYNCGWYAEGNSVRQTDDGGYIAAGEAVIDNIDQQLYLVKTDSMGNTLWTITSGSTSMAEIAFSVQQTTDGGYIAIGIKVGYMGSCNPYLVKTDSLGNILWTKTHSFGGNNNEAHSIRQTADGGYIYTGLTNAVESQGDVLLVKTDSFGNVLWSKFFGKTSVGDNAFSIKLNTDKGYIIAGHTNYVGFTPHNFYLIKTDSLGNYTPAVNVYVPDITYGSLNDTITVPINIEEITSVGVTSSEFVLTYNSAVISGIDVDASGTLLSGTDWIWEYNVVGDEFSVTMSGTDELTANGTLINLRFVVLSDTVAGGVSPLHFESFLFNQGIPEAVTHDGIFIVRGGAIEGIVTEAEKGPVENAIVTLYDEFTYCDTTDASGHYFISEIVPDTYNITVTASGYNNFDTTGIIVISGDTSVVNLALPYPDIGVTPDAFYIALSQGSTLDTFLYITNNGNGLLEYRIKVTDGSGGGVPGAIIESHPSVGEPTAFEWDGTYFWQANKNKEVVKLDGNFNVIATYTALGGSQTQVSALTWHDGYLYQGWMNGNRMFKVDVQTGYEPLDTIYIRTAGLDWVGDHCWISNGYYQTSTIYEYDSLWNAVNSLSCPVGGMCGISYNPYLDSLYICPGVWWNTIYSLNPNTGIFNPAFTTPGSHPPDENKCVGSSYDSRYPAYIWIAHRYDNMIYLVNTGNEVVQWLPVEPVCGSIIPGETFPVTLHFDATKFNYDTICTAEILINNNSANPLMTIPVTMDVTIVGVEDAKLYLPKLFALSQNYPNPFSRTTEITYQLPVSCKVVLKIYNMIGHEIRTLVNENQTEGEYSIIWDGRDDSGNHVGLGLYFYRLNINGKTISANKCLLLK